MEENNIGFEDIPNAITRVLKKLSSLEDKTDGIYELVQSEKEEAWFTITELYAYLPARPVEHTVYCWTSDREIPFHKRGKRIMFLKSEVDERPQGTKGKSENEIQREAKEYILSIRRKNRRLI